MAKITLRQLRYFTSLAEQGHFGRAAEVSAVSQPALSMQIRELEALLGATLFERTARQVRPTAFAELLLPRAQAILQAADELEDLARAQGDALAGRLRLGVIPTVAPYLLPAIMARLGRDFPGLDLHPRETVTPRLLAELSEGRIDAALIALPAPDPSLVGEELFSESFVLVRPAEDAGRPVPGPEKLREMRLLLLEEGHCFRDQALSFCDMASSAPRELMDATSLTTLVQMVSAGIGVTLIPEMAVAVETRLAPISVSAFEGEQPRRTLGLVWRRSNPLAAQLRQVAGSIRLAAGRGDA